MTMLLAALLLLIPDAQDAPTWTSIHEIFEKHCNACHNPKEMKGELDLKSHASLLKGGENGAVFVAGKPDESLLIRLVDQIEKPFMPPPKKGRKLSDAERGLLRAWVAAGAPGPKAGDAPPKALAVPRIAPKIAPRKAVNAVDFDPKGRYFALARLGVIELCDATTRAVVRTLAGHPGSVNALAFSPDGATLVAAGGEPGVAGEVRLWNVADGTLIQAIRGHEDAIYALALSPDGKSFATGGYDRAIHLWERGQDQPIRSFKGHNEAVVGLSFRPDGKVLASASADRTVKLWDVSSGERRDTLGDATKSLNAVAFSPDGKSVAAGGVDNRIRVWSVSGDAKEGTNPLRSSSFAHEGAILRLAYAPDGKTLVSSADDRSVKLWNVADMAPKLAVETQSDWPTALAFAPDGKSFLAGRLDGTYQIYDLSGKTAALPKPELTGLEPRGVQRGTTGTITLLGKNLSGELKTNDAGLRLRRLDASRLEVTAGAEHAPGEAELWISGPGGDSAKLKLFIDTLPQVSEKEGEATVATLPVSLWGSLLVRGDADAFAFDGVKGQKLVVDAAAKRLGSKADLVLTLTDASGRLIAGNIDFEGEADPLIFTVLPADGRYQISVRDLQLGASSDHYYRLSLGDFGVVTGTFPLAVPANVESELRLVGINLGEALVRVKAGATGEVAVPVDPARFRSRRDLKALVSTLPELLEGGKPTAMSAPGGAAGRLLVPGETDLYRFESPAGKTWAIETVAASRGSPVDTRLEVLHTDGRPVERVVLRALRDSYLTFRPIDANQGGGRFWNYQEMDLGQLLYLQGEVMRLFLAPQGPDSEWKFFTQGGKRRGYFDTSATAHPLDAPAYIVEAHPPGTMLPPNGLPLFPVYYANDDDADRKLGTDSKLLFTAPRDGAYLVRVSDTRGAGGERFVYRLVVRESAPDFRASLEGVNPKVPLGTGSAFTVRVERIDGYEGPVTVEISGLPEGFSASTPLLIEPGHLEAKGTLYASIDCTPPSAADSAAVKVVAVASPGGREIRKDLNGFGALSLLPAPKTVVWLEPDPGAGADAAATADPRRVQAEASGRDGRTITVKPGGRVSAILKIRRTNHNERVTFDVENLPFGVIVDDIGLNGILIPEGQTERRIFLLCASWTPETLRPCYARVREAPNPGSAPALLRVPPR